jgi:hypothetical protein
MTEPTQGDLSPDKVAELQQKLAAASAEVAKVQAELQAAGGAAPATPMVPYGGPQSPTVTVQGQQVLVNGQPVAPGQQVDLSTYLSPQVAEQIRTSLSQLGLSGHLGGLFGAPPGLAEPATPTSVARLADPPRHVPFQFKLATFNWNWWEVFAIFLVAIAPIAIWGEFPELIPYALVVGVAIIAFFRIRKYVRRIGLLKWGKVATVTNTAELARGTYYSGTTYSNMFMRQANVGRDHVALQRAWQHLEDRLHARRHQRLDQAPRPPVQQRRGPRGLAEARTRHGGQPVPVLGEARRRRPVRRRAVRVGPRWCHRHARARGDARVRRAPGCPGVLGQLTQAYA